MGFIFTLQFHWKNSLEKLKFAKWLSPEKIKSWKNLQTSLDTQEKIDLDYKQINVKEIIYQTNQGKHVRTNLYWALNSQFWDIKILGRKTGRGPFSVRTWLH